MKGKYILVLDCGATNIRAVVLNEKGKVVTHADMPNNTQPDPYFADGLIWDVDEIWSKFIKCVQRVTNIIDPINIEAITITTFGVNGAPVDAQGNLLYPVVSWQCQRTLPIMKNIDKYFLPQRLYELSGVNFFHFNTINTLIWLKKHHPKIIDNMKAFLFMPSIFIHKLTEEIVNDTTMAGTSMLTDYRSRNFSDEILNTIGVPNRFGKLSEPGTIAGNLTQSTAKKLGLPKGIPVVLAGHDTQFALIGSGAEENDVVLSSGTWEILMARIRNIKISSQAMQMGITNELDALPGLYNSGMQWLASGVLEWIKKMFFALSEYKDKESIYKLMIEEASKSKSTGLKFITNFDICEGAISGIGLNTTRGEIYRAALESLSVKLKNSLDILENIGGFKANSLIVGGGSTRNKLWNQIRANTLGIPLKLHKEKETTVIGAAILALTATGKYQSLNQALEALKPDYDIVRPEAD